jgi:hypothetical protein
MKTHTKINFTREWGTLKALQGQKNIVVPLFVCFEKPKFENFNLFAFYFYEFFLSSLYHKVKL